MQPSYGFGPAPPYAPPPGQQPHSGAGPASSGPPGYAPQQPSYGQPPPAYGQPQQQGQGMPHVSSYPGPMGQQAGYGGPQPSGSPMRGGQPPGPAPWMPGPPAPQLQHQQQYAGVPAHQQYGMPQAYGAGPQQQHGGMPQMQMPMPGIPGMGGGSGGFMGGFNPVSLMTGGLFSAPQAYMQQRMGWVKANMTGGTMAALFNISNSYVRSKLLMLLTPFLPKWTYTRLHEQIAGGQRYRPPAVDVNAPDLFIPLLGAWAYALLSAVVLASKGSFRPEAMNSTLYGACIAWFLHWLVARLLLRGMSVPGVPWSELLAYTGYPFVPICLTTVAGFVAGKWGYYAVGAYGALCMAAFMVKTMKRVIFQEARAYGADMRMANYLLLALGAFEFPFTFFMAAKPI